MKTQLNKMLPSPQQPLNGQGVQRISGYKFKNNKTDNQMDIIGIRTSVVYVAKELRKSKEGICGLQEV